MILLSSFVEKRKQDVVQTFLMPIYRGNRRHIHCAYCSELFSEGEPTFWSFVHPHCLFGNATTIFKLPESIPNWSTFPAETKSHIQFNLAISDNKNIVTAMTFPRPETLARRPKRYETWNAMKDLDDVVRKRKDNIWKQIWNVYEILKHNNREIAGTREECLDDLAEIVQFGPSLNCTEISTPKSRLYAEVNNFEILAVPNVKQTTFITPLKRRVAESSKMLQ